jgi:ATP-dependent DNA helicase RecQ
VLVLDAGDWPTNQPDERRLLYVAMTRAKETLTLFQATQRGNPMLAGLDELEAVRRVEPKVVPLRSRAQPAPGAHAGDVHLTSPAASRLAAVHQACGAPRGPMRRDGGRSSTSRASGCALSASCRGKVVSVRVLAIVRRTRAQSAADYQEALKVDGWEVVVPEVVVARLRRAASPVSGSRHPEIEHRLSCLRCGAI